MLKKQYHMKGKRANTALLFCLFAFLLLAQSCARMGEPDGGWYDEQPPRILATSPADKSTDVSSKKITIFFDEFVNLDNPTEKVTISPPQLEQAEIKGQGKKVRVELQDSLRPNTTYTVDFSDAISDNNEGNPLGNYTYTFSTGDHIDTLEVAGYVLNAEDLEPVKGIMVGLYSNLQDSAFTTEPMLRVARTDDHGHFSVKGVAPGDYRIYALQDADGNYRFTQPSEAIAFTPEIITPSFKPDIRQDTIWRDTLHIANITQTPYTHFLPDDVVLRAFNETLTDRFFTKAERKTAEAFTVFFSYGDSLLPDIHGLNFDARNAFVTEPSVDQDTITYWLRDTALVNQDTLRFAMTSRQTDSTGVLREKTDTIEVLSRDPYARRLKRQQEAREKWEKKQNRRKSRGLSYDSVMPPTPLEPTYHVQSAIAPAGENPTMVMPHPLAVVDTAKVHLYEKHDTLWYRSRFLFGEKVGQARTYELVGEWSPGTEYSLEIDSAAFIDIYGRASKPYKSGFSVNTNESYGTLTMTLQGMEGRTSLVELLSRDGKVVKQEYAEDGVVTFHYIKPATYYVRLIEDDNHNGRWDTGLYSAQRQPEAVYYYPKGIEIRAKWDVSETWQPRLRPLYLQKPSAITKQKGSKKKTIRNRNAERAAKLGIDLPMNLRR